MVKYFKGSCWRNRANGFQPLEQNGWIVKNCSFSRWERLELRCRECFLFCKNESDLGCITILQTQGECILPFASGKREETIDNNQFFTGKQCICTDSSFKI